MSTTDPPSATHGVQDIDRNRLSLPSFAPTRNARDGRTSRAESSTSSSRWSVNDRRSRSPSDYRAGSSVIESDDGKQNAVLTNTPPRRNHNRSSGGFLLEPTTHSSNVSRAVLSQSQRDVKGKRKSEVPEISLPKRRNRWSILDQDPSMRSSPLSVEVRQDQDERMNGTPLGPGMRLQDASISQNGLSTVSGSQGSTTPSVGLDTDPAQIVDMALKLSEGRRRQASGKRFVSSETSMKRMLSTSSSRQVRTPTKSLGQHLTSLNTTSPSPIPSTLLQNGTNDGGDDTVMIDDSFLYNTPSKIVAVAEPAVEISRATASRVMKARVYLELAYEHRRLLSHLPPVRRPGTQAVHDGTLEDSKSYNPLQYARNRKLRIRERTTIDVEGDGWHDIEKVRAWVNAIIDSHPETSHDPLECVRLPPLSLQEEVAEASPQSPQAHTSPQSPTQPPNKLRKRPKSDWVTHPGDLLADAYWLEQGLNKTRIQDRDNHPIYPPNTPFKFSGWRNRTPGDLPTPLQEPTPPPEKMIVEKTEPPLSAAPELPTFKSAHKDESRGRKRSKLKGRLAKKRSDSRKRRLAMLAGSSDSSSESDIPSPNLDRNESTRGRERTSRLFDLPDGDPFARPVSEIYNDYDASGRLNSSDPNLLGRDSARSSVDHSRIVNYLKRNSTLNPPLEDRGRSPGVAKKRNLFQSSKEPKDKNKRGHDSGDDDSTATDTSGQHALPSITIDLETPVSRSPSPTKKSRSSILQSFRDKPKPANQNKIETTDFAKQHERSHSRGISVDLDKIRGGPDQTSRETSPKTRGTSPFTKSRRESTHSEFYSSSTVDQRSGVISRQSTKLTMPPQDQPSRIRGMFKGGRIAELVGNEVTRVGDFIWKREIPPAYRHQMSGSEASFNSYGTSDTDEDLQNGYLHKTQPRDPRVSVSSQINSGRQLHDTSRTGEKPQLNNPNLPSFTSPFQRDREKQEKQEKQDKQEKKQNFLMPGGQIGTDDHISQQAAQHRKRSKSPRLDRIAPPKLDTSLPQTVGVLERKHSYGFSTALKRPQSASRSLNDVINSKSARNTSGRSSTAGLPSRLRQSAEGSVASANSGKIERRDLSRIEALLLISAVKARNISASYDQIPTEPSKVLIQALASSKRPRGHLETLKVRKRDEHVLAAQNLISYLTDQSKQISKQIHAFTDSTIPLLHKQIQTIEDQIENTITPRVNAAADSAGELSVKLTTTSTQAVKSMHDVVTEAFRFRRRGALRWFRLLGYAAIEWLVVGLLWLIWAIVTVIRISLGIVGSAGKVLKWLFWIT